MASGIGSSINQLADEARKRPILIVGGAVAILLMAALLNRRSSSDSSGDDLSADDLGTDDPTDPAAGDVGYASTNPFPSGGSYFDPGSFDMETGGTVAPQTTPDGCSLPAPVPPAGYTAVCAGGSWVFQKVPTTGGGTTPAPTAKGPRITIPKGRAFRHYALRNGKLVDGKSRTAGAAVTWKTSPTPVRRKTAGGSTINAVQLKSGPLSGRYVGTSIGSWHRS